MIRAKWISPGGAFLTMSLQEIKDLLTKPIGEKTEGKARKRRVSAPTDVVGIELGAGDSRGCPAVRLVRRKEKWTVRAIGFVPPPTGDLPTSWQGLDQQPAWTIPAPFTASAAALAVNSFDAVVRQTTLESLPVEDGKAPMPGVPVSHDGIRFAIAPLDEASFVLESGLPEYQALWLSRLLPEGRRPTACSVQTVPTAMLAALATQPELQANDGNAAALLVTESSIYFVGFRNGALVLFREFPGVGGAAKIREALKAGFGMEDKMLDEVLNDTLIDSSPILVPIVNPIFRQLELSLDYLKSRLNLSVDKVLMMGLPCGANHWCRMAEDSLSLQLVAPDVFAGVELTVGFDPTSEALLKKSGVFMAAFGAARAAMEVAE